MDQVVELTPTEAVHMQAKIRNLMQDRQFKQAAALKKQYDAAMTRAGLAAFEQFKKRGYSV
jgi:hypothetical protein